MSRSLAEQLVASGEMPGFIASLSNAERADLLYRWQFWQRPAQRPPDGSWRTWFIRAGRGYGKTRTGAETVRRRVEQGLSGRVALIAPTAGDARDVMVEGESGLIAVHPRATRPIYESSKRRLTWPNGAVGTLFSAEEPDRLRGPQHDFAWGDEPASWKQGKATFDNAVLGLRLGADPRMVLTGTPKPTAWLRKVAQRPSTVTTSGSTYENIANLAEAFIDEVLDAYEGTTLGLQELHAQWLDDVEGALWVESKIEEHRWPNWIRDLSWRTVIGVDPPGETAECGIVVATAPTRADRTAHAVVLDDASMAGRPEAWGAQVVAAWRRWGADAVLVESNQGGDMVRAVVHAVDPTCPVRKIRASESKKARAEPVSTLYERGRVHHAGNFAMLESQMVTWVPGVSKSPDRVDALVHAITELLPTADRTSRVASVAHLRIPSS